MENISESSEEEKIGENDIAELIDERLKSNFASKKALQAIYRRHLISKKTKPIR